MPDFPAFFPGLITCCRPRLSPTCLPRLCPGYYLSLLSSTTSFAYSLLVTHLLGSVATQLTTGPVCQLGNPSVVGFALSQRHQAHSFSDLAEDHCEPRLFTLPLYKLLKTAVTNKGHYRLISRLPVLLLGPRHSRDSTIWPDMDPAHTPMDRLEKVEAILQHHEALLFSNSADVRLAVAKQEQAFTSLAGGLLGLNQGCRSVADYSIHFRTQASSSEWNQAALCDAFLMGLADYIKDGLISYELPTTLDGIIELASRIDRRIQARQREKHQGLAGRRQPAPSPAASGVSMLSGSRSSGEPEPMQVGRASLTPEERRRRHEGNLCLYSGQAGQFISGCPLKGRAHQEGRSSW